MGVVLAAREQTPEQARELARDSDDRPCRGRGGRGCAHRTRAAGRAAGRRSRPPRPAPSAPTREPRLEIRPPRGRLAAGLADARVKAEVADQLPRGSRKRRMSPTAARNVAAQITLTPGTVISRRDRRPSAAPRARSAARPRRSLRRGTRRGAGALATVSASSTGSSSSDSHARPLTPNRSDTGGRPSSRRISTAWISFFARERERTNCSRRARRRRITRQRSSGDHTASSSPAANSLASVRASSRSVFARA